MIRKVTFNKEVSKGIKEGAEIVFNAVASTMGRNGKYVAIQDQFNENYLTKDGFYSAKTIFLEDALQNVGAQMIKEVAQKAANSVGDGTTTTTVLAYHIFLKGLEAIENGANPIDLKKGISKGVEIAIKQLKKNATPLKGSIKMIEQVATVSANNDESIGKLIGQAMKRIKPEGIINVEESQTMESSIEIVDGMRFDSGFYNPYFVTDPEKMVVELEDTYILIYDSVLTKMEQIIPVLEFIATENKSLLIIAKAVEQEALSTLLVNKTRNGMRLAAVKCPGYGEMKNAWLHDIASVCGAIVISESKGETVETFVPEMLGSAKKVKITKEHCSIIGGYSIKEAKEERVSMIRNELKKATGKHSIDFLKDRLAKIDGGVAILKIGATTEVEMKEKKDLLEDAIAATKSALEEGVIAGGGSSLVHASKALINIEGDNHDETIGINIVRKAMHEPLNVIMNNSGYERQSFLKSIFEALSGKSIYRLSSDVILADVLKSDDINIGFDLNTNTLCDMIKAGILDTVKVERMALENSASVASMMLMTNTCIYNAEKSTKE